MKNVKKTELELFQQDKQSNILLSKKLRDIDLKESNSLKDCCSWYETNVYTKKNNFSDIKTRKKINHTCKSKFCVICEKRKNGLFFNGVKDNLEKLDNTQYGIIFITLTVENPNLKDLDKTLSVMSKSQELFRKNLQYKYFGKQTSREGGYFSATEITYTDKQGNLKLLNGVQQCHPHKHIIQIVPISEIKNKSIDNNEFRTLWKRSLKKFSNMNGNVNVRFIKGQSVIKELIKYTTKHSEYINYPNLIPEIKKQLKGKRMYSSSGLLKVSLVKQREIATENILEEVKELKINYEKVLTYKRIFVDEKNYYNIYDLKWSRDFTNQEKFDILLELHLKGELHYIEMKYLKSKIEKGTIKDFDIEELYLDNPKYDFNLDLNTNQMKVIEKEELTFEEIEIKLIRIDNELQKIGTNPKHITRRVYLEQNKRKLKTMEKELEKELFEGPGIIEKMKLKKRI